MVDINNSGSHLKELEMEDLGSRRRESGKRSERRGRDRCGAPPPR